MTNLSIDPSLIRDAEMHPLLARARDSMSAEDKQELSFKLVMASRWDQDRIVREYLAPRITAIAFADAVLRGSLVTLDEAAIGDRTKWRSRTVLLPR